MTEREGALWWGSTRLMGVEELRLRGAHNRLNAMAAAAVTLARGMAPDAVREGLASFGGVAHRLEEVGDPRRRALRQRLQGHERRLRRRGPRVVRRRRAR